MPKTDVQEPGSPVYLLDSSVLIPLTSADHIHYERARNWLPSVHRFATCPITEGALIRFSMHLLGKSSLHFGKQLLASLYALPNHVFWPDDLSYLHIPDRGIYGHKQVTDAYLAALARAHGGLLATMDETLAALHPATLLI